MTTTISTLRAFSSHTVSRVRLELETLDGNTQLFDAELTKPHDAGVEFVQDVLFNYHQRIGVLAEQKFSMRAKLTVTSASGSMTHISEDLMSVLPIFDMATKLLSIRK